MLKVRPLISMYRQPSDGSMFRVFASAGGDSEAYERHCASPYCWCWSLTMAVVVAVPPQVVCGTVRAEDGSFAGPTIR